MKTNHTYKHFTHRRLRYFGKMALLALGLFFSILICIHSRLILSLPKFFCMMREVPPWTTVNVNVPAETYPLDKLKRVACFLLKQSERDRRVIVATYNIYARAHTDDLPISSKLYLLLRLIFDVPEEYSRNNAKFFGGWRGWLEERTLAEGGTANLLWPLGYQSQRLVLKGTLAGYYGLPYNGLGEYDYFASHFPLRSVDVLK